MSVRELRKAYDELPEAERILFASVIAADLLSRSDEFAAVLTRRHRAMDEGKKWTHADALKLHEELAKNRL